MFRADSCRAKNFREMLISHVPLLNNSLGSGLELYALRRETTNTCVESQLYRWKTYNTSGSVETSRFASSTVRFSHTRECCEGNNLLLRFNTGILQGQPTHPSLQRIQASLLTNNTYVDASRILFHVCTSKSWPSEVAIIWDQLTYPMHQDRKRHQRLDGWWLAQSDG